MWFWRKCRRTVLLEGICLGLFVFHLTWWTSLEAPEDKQEELFWEHTSCSRAFSPWYQVGATPTSVFGVVFENSLFPLYVVSISNTWHRFFSQRSHFCCSVLSTDVAVASEAGVYLAALGKDAQVERLNPRNPRKLVIRGPVSPAPCIILLIHSLLTDVFWRRKGCFCKEWLFRAVHNWLSVSQTQMVCRIRNNTCPYCVPVSQFAKINLVFLGPQNGDAAEINIVSKGSCGQFQTALTTNRSFATDFCFVLSFF